MHTNIYSYMLTYPYPYTPIYTYTYMHTYTYTYTYTHIKCPSQEQTGVWEAVGGTLVRAVALNTVCLKLNHVSLCHFMVTI